MVVEDPEHFIRHSRANARREPKVDRVLARGCKGGRAILACSISPNLWHASLQLRPVYGLMVPRHPRGLQWRLVDVWVEVLALVTFCA